MNEIECECEKSTSSCCRKCSLVSEMVTSLAVHQSDDSSLRTHVRQLHYKLAFLCNLVCRQQTNYSCSSSRSSCWVRRYTRMALKDALHMRDIINSCKCISAKAKCCALYYHWRSGDATSDEADLCYLMCKQVEATGQLQIYTSPLSSTDLDWVLGKALAQYVPDQGEINWVIVLAIKAAQAQLHQVRQSRKILHTI